MCFLSFYFMSTYVHKMFRKKTFDLNFRWVHKSYWSLIHIQNWIDDKSNPRKRALNVQVAHLNTRPETYRVKRKTHHYWNMYIGGYYIYICPSFSSNFRIFLPTTSYEEDMEYRSSKWSSTDLVAWNLLKMAAIWNVISGLIKFIYSEKATKFCEISIVDLTVTT